MRLTFRAVRTGYRRYACFLCGEATWKELVQIEAVDQEGEPQGNVCRACLESPQTAISRSHSHAAQLQAYAAALASLTIEDIPTAPTLTDLDVLSDAAERENAAEEFAWTSHE